MDSDTRATWRQVNKQACMDVNEATRILSWRQEQDGHAPVTATRMHGQLSPPPRPSPPSTPLPSALFAKLPSLARLQCSGMAGLRSLDGLPSGLTALVCHGVPGITSFAPLSLCPSLRELSINTPYAPPGVGFRDCGALSPCTALVSLNLAHNALGPEGAQHLASVLPSLSALQHLSLANNLLGLPGVASLAPSIQALAPSLLHLELSANDVGVEGIMALGPAIQALSHLQHLGLALNRLGAGGVEALAPFLRPLTSLQGLDLSVNSLGPRGAAALWVAAPYLQQLRELDLSLNSLGPRGAGELASVLGAWTALRSLHLGFNQMGARGAALLAPALLLQLSGLTHLDLAGNGLGAAGAETMQALLPALTDLSELHLDSNDLGPQGVGALAPALQALGGSLRALGLASNRVGDEGLSTLAPAFSALTGLTRLNLASNGLGNASGAATGAAPQPALLLSAVVHLTALRKLCLTGNDLGPSGSDTVATALTSALPSLTRLDLDGVGSSGAEGSGATAAASAPCALAPAIAKLTGLRELSFVNSSGSSGQQATPPLRVGSGASLLQRGGSSQLLLHSSGSGLPSRESLHSSASGLSLSGPSSMSFDLGSMRLWEGDEEMDRLMVSDDNEEGDEGVE